MTIRIARVVVGFALALSGFPRGVDAQPRYQIIDVGRSSGAICAGPGMNPAGQAFINQTIDMPRTFLVDSRGTRSEVATGFGTVGLAINAAGQIAGYIQDQGFRPFLWTPGVGWVDLAGPPRTGFPCGLNNAGDVVGEFDTTGHGFLYSRGRMWDLQNDLAPIGGEDWDLIGRAESINDAGQILGYGTKKGLVHSYIMIPLNPTSPNLLREPGFEGYTPPALHVPGWVSDSIRQVAAKSEFNQPHTGGKNGACWATLNLDCGMYQQVSAPATGTYSLTLYASADRAGGLIGANVNGATVASMAVNPRGYRNYGAAYTMTFRAAQGSTIRVWMYSPAAPGYVVIDDVSLTQVP